MNTRPNSQAPGGRIPAPTHAQIAALAHEIWIERGRPAGTDIDIWLEAERQLTGHAPQPSRPDPIPADMHHPGIDDDPAVNPDFDRDVSRFGNAGTPRSPTSFGV